MRIFIDSINQDINDTIKSKLDGNTRDMVYTLEIKHTYNLKKLKDVDLNLFPNISELILHNNYGYTEWADVRDGLIKFSHITKLTMYNFVIFRGLFIKNYKNLTNLQIYDVHIKNLYFLKYINNLTTLNIGTNKIDDISGIKHLKNLEHFSYQKYNISTKIDIPIFFKNLKTVSLKYLQLQEKELYQLYPFLCSDSLKMFDVGTETHKSLIYGICHFYNIDAFIVSQNWIKYCKMYIAILHRNKQLEELCV